MPPFARVQRISGLDKDPLSGRPVLVVVFIEDGLASLFVLCGQSCESEHARCLASQLRSCELHSTNLSVRCFFCTA